MKSKIVVKFGGSNLKNQSDFKKLVATITHYNQPLVVVVSAFYGVTNLLTEILEKIKIDESYITEFSEYFYKLQFDIIEQNIENEYIRQEAIIGVENRLAELKKFLLGIHYIGDVPKFVEDTILSYGEKFSSMVLTAILLSHGFNCQEVWPEQMNMLTDGEFGNATVDLEASEHSIKQTLSEDKIYVVPGFYGVSTEGKITLLGRGGTDYSAAAIAACINATSLDIWKDVDGFMSADPKLVANPLKIKKLSYLEAAELSYFGARILHPRTVEPLMDKYIPIRIFNIDLPGQRIEPLTIINSERTVVKNTIKSVTHSDDFGILKLRGPGLGIKHGILASVTKAINQKDINIKSVFTSHTTINLLMAQKDLPQVYAMIDHLDLATVHDISTFENISIIALVGEGLLDNYGVAARIFNAVAEKHINVKMATLGSSQVSAYLVVDKKDKELAIKEIHNHFFNEE